MDLRANDLCEALSQLAIKDFVVVEGSGEESWAPGGERGATFIDEAAGFLATMPQQFGLTYQLPTFGNAGHFGPRSYASGSAGGGSDNGATTPSESAELSPSPLGSASFHRSAPPLTDVLKFLPNDKAAMSAYTYYCGYVSWSVALPWSLAREFCSRMMRPAGTLILYTCLPLKRNGLS